VLANGVKELLNQLRIDGRKVGFLTNNSRQNSTDITLKLQNMGLQVSRDEVMTATEYVGLYLFEKYGPCTVKKVGSEGLYHSIESTGHREAADFIVVGRDTGFHFSKLQRIAVEVEKGAIVAAIESVIEKQIECVGKPDRHMFMHGLKRLGLTPDECVMVGDNLKTDIAGGIQAGLRKVWVRGGQSLGNLRNLHSSQPDYTVKDIMELLILYK
jgi:ribonucleotide monophosphatase NagD (HAD superfamily)